MDPATESTAAADEKAKRAEIVAAVRLRHSGVDPYEYTGGDLFFVYRRCTRGEREVYRKLTRDDRRSDAQDSLMACVLYPEKEPLKKTLDDYPFVIEMLETAILNASGLHLDAVSKKA